MGILDPVVPNYRAVKIDHIYKQSVTISL